MRDFMKRLIESSDSMLKGETSILEWFDPKNAKHMEAFAVLQDKGQWPHKFIPEGLEFPRKWKTLLTKKVNEALPDKDDPKMDKDPDPATDEVPEDEVLDNDSEDELLPDEESAEIDFERLYLGRTEDTHFYLEANKSDDDEGAVKDLQVVDQDGEELYSAEEQGLDITNVATFIKAAIEDLNITSIVRNVVLEYLIPEEEARIEAEDIEDEEELPDTVEDRENPAEDMNKKSSSVPKKNPYESIIREQDDEEKMDKDLDSDEELEGADEFSLIDPDEKVDVDFEKFFFGSSLEKHYYVVSDKGEGGILQDLKIVDQEGNEVYSATKQGIDPSNVAEFILSAIQDVDILTIEKNPILKYIAPHREEQFLEEPAEEDEEMELGLEIPGEETPPEDPNLKADPKPKADPNLKADPKKEKLPFESRENKVKEKKLGLDYVTQVKKNIKKVAAALKDKDAIAAAEALDKVADDASDASKALKKMKAVEEEDIADADAKEKEELAESDVDESKVNEVANKLKEDDEFNRLVQAQLADPDNLDAKEAVSGYVQQVWGDVLNNNSQAVSNVVEQVIAQGKESHTAISSDSKILETNITDGKGNSFSINVIDEGDKDVTLQINQREFHFKPDFAKLYGVNEAGRLTDEGVKAIALETIGHLDETDYAELIGSGKMKEAKDDKSAAPDTGADADAGVWDNILKLKSTAEEMKAKGYRYIMIFPKNSGLEPLFTKTTKQASELLRDDYKTIKGVLIQPIDKYLGAAVEEGLQGSARDIYINSNNYLGWDVLQTKKGGYQATVLFVFDTEEEASAAGEQIANAIGGTFHGKSDPRSLRSDDEDVDVNRSKDRDKREPEKEGKVVEMKRKKRNGNKVSNAIDMDLIKEGVELTIKGGLLDGRKATVQAINEKNISVNVVDDGGAALNVNITGEANINIGADGSISVTPTPMEFPMGSEDIGMADEVPAEKEIAGAPGEDEEAPEIPGGEEDLDDEPFESKGKKKTEEDEMNLKTDEAKDKKKTEEDEMNLKTDESSGDGDCPKPGDHDYSEDDTRRRPGKKKLRIPKPGDHDYSEDANKAEYESKTSEAKAEEGKVSESTYEDFVSSYGKDLQVLLRKAKDFALQFEQKLQKQSPRSRYRSAEAKIKRIENTYDKEVVNQIYDMIIAGSDFRTTFKELTDLALSIQDKYGTEPRQLVNALEDVYGQVTNEGIGDQSKEVFEVEFIKDGKSTNTRVMAYDEGAAKKMLEDKPSVEKVTGVKQISGLDEKDELSGSPEVLPQDDEPEVEPEHEMETGEDAGAGEFVVTLTASNPRDADEEIGRFATPGEAAEFMTDKDSDSEDALSNPDRWGDDEAEGGEEEVVKLTTPDGKEYVWAGGWVNAESQDYMEDEVPEDDMFSRDAVESAKRLLGLDDVDEFRVEEAIVVGDTVQVCDEKYKCLVEEATVHDIDEEKGYELSGNTIPEEQIWYSNAYFQIDKL